MRHRLSDNMHIQAYSLMNTALCMNIAPLLLWCLLASCLIYARALLEYAIVIVWVRSVNKVLPSVKFAEDKVLTFLILCEEC